MKAPQLWLGFSHGTKLEFRIVLFPARIQGLPNMCRAIPRRENKMEKRMGTEKEVTLQG